MRESYCSFGDMRRDWHVRFPHPALLLSIAAGAIFVPRAAAGEIKPYLPDQWTLHLWHLDESTPPFSDQGSNTTPLRAVHNNAVCAVPSVPLLGKCVSLDHDAGGQRGDTAFRGGILTESSEIVEGDSDNVNPGFRFAGDDGAFTIEALVRFNVLPTQSGNPAMDVVSLEGDRGGKEPTRVFNFQIDSGGFLAFTPLEVPGGALAAIPTTGPHAVNTADWFHLAVTYDGKEGTDGNLKLYWTRLTSDPVEAHLIGSGTLANDLLQGKGDFAIGNESRTLFNNNERDQFRGLIDEVRISSLVRHPTDYLFVLPGLRQHPMIAPDDANTRSKLGLEITGIAVDGCRTVISGLGNSLEVPPGAHRLDFDFGVPSDILRESPLLRYRMKGLDESWSESARGMLLTCEVLDGSETVVSLVRIPVLGASKGWSASIDDSSLTPRKEPVFIPETGKKIRISLTSGTPDTTGVFVVDDLDLQLKLSGKDVQHLWKNSAFDRGNRLDIPSGIPEGWSRSGSAPTIARVMVPFKGEVTIGPTPIRPNLITSALALVDGDQAAFGTWTSTQSLPAVPKGGVNMLLAWKEMYNVIGGGIHQASFVSVPAGNYVFEAIAESVGSNRMGSHVALSVKVLAPLWSRPWFWAFIASVVVTSMATGAFALLRQRSARKVNRLRMQNALAKDRARIARDMHDDLGTRITVLTMNAALAQKNLGKSPEAASRHLGNLMAASRNLVSAMDDMVWAIDPRNDNLVGLGIHLAGLADELFRESEVRYTVSIPKDLPERILHADFRHHISMAVKESLHNILRHAGPCHAFLELEIDRGNLRITIEDSGRGFDTRSPEAGNGLKNRSDRLADVGGICQTASAPGKGTRIVMECPLPPSPVSNT